MLRTLVHLSAVLACACLLTGCYTMGLHETARTAPPGAFEGGGILTPVFVSLDSGAGGIVVFPYPELYGKVGLSDNFDLGIRWAFGPGLGVDGKYRFVSKGVEVAARLGTSFYGFYGSGIGIGYYTLSPRVVVSQEPESGLPWAFNAGVDYFGMFASVEQEGAGAGMLSLRAGAGLPFRVVRSLRIMPEVDVSVPLVGSFSPGGGIEFLPGGGAILTLGISIGRVVNEEEASGGWWKP